MKPIKDIFTSHIQGLYKGHEVDAPESIQEGVFNQLDAMNESTVSVNASGGFTSKAVIGAAVVIVGFAWYLMPVSEDQVVVDEVEFVEEIVGEIAVEEVDIVEERVVIEALNEVKVVPEVVDVSVEEPIFVEKEIQKTVVVSVVDDVKLEVVIDTNVDVEIIEKAVPTEEVIKIKEAQEPEAVLEWVLPAKLEVDE